MFDIPVGDLADVDETVLMHADVHERAEVDDVADGAGHHHAGAINKLCMFSANYNSVFGEGNNRISKERAQNVVSILEKLITCTEIGINTGEGSDYDTFKKMLNKV